MTVKNPRTITSKPSRPRPATTRPVRTTEETGLDPSPTTLRWSEELFRMLIQTMREGVGVLDKNGTLIFTNDRFCQMLGYAQDELLGRPVKSLFQGPANRKKIEEELAKRRRNGQEPYEAELTKKDGQKISVSVSPSVIRDARGNFAGSFAVITDITQRKRAEDALRRSEARLADAQRVARMGSWDWNLIDNSFCWSDEIYRIFGLAPDEFAATYAAFLRAVHPNDRELVQRHVDAALRDNTPYAIDHRIVRPDGEVRYVHEQAEVTRDADGSPVRMIGTVIDVTERKRAEEALRKSERLRLEAEKLAANGRMAARIAHEINNPLAGIKNICRLVAETVPDEHGCQGWVRQLDGEIGRVADIIRQMLDLHRPTRLTATEVGIAHLLSEVAGLVKPAAEKRSVYVQIDMESPSLVAKLPEKSLRQVLFNLLINAVDASPERGTVKISAAATENTLRFAVTDQGPGVPEELRSRIFDPFFSTKGQEATGGLGLGLSISKGIAEAVGGSLDFLNQPHGGCVFRFSVPRIPLNEGEGNVQGRKNSDC